MFRPVSNKVDFPKMEEDILKFWEENDICDKSIEQRPLIVMENVEEGGFFGRMWDFVMMKFHQWFGSWFS